MQYSAGDNEEHRVDHPPFFACREHKNLLRFTNRFVMELIACGQDIMPGNPDELALAFLKEAEPAFRLPEFLIPPKVVLFNPRGLRGAEALPFCMVLVDKKFFGIPAKYLTPERFDGCDECAQLRGAPAQRRPPAAVRPGAAPSGVGQGLRPQTPVPGPVGSGVRRPGPAGATPPPSGVGGPRQPGKGPPRPGPRPQ